MPGLKAEAFKMNHDRIMELYNREIWDARLQEITRDRIHWVCSKAKGQTVLDIGCSQGIVPILLAREGYHVTGVDVDPQAIQFAKEYQENEFPNTKERCQFFCADIFAQDFEKEFDTIILTEVLEHFSEPSVLLNRALSFLKPGGRVVVTVPFGIHRDIDHKSTHTILSVYKLLSERLTVEDIDAQGKYVRAVSTFESHGKKNGSQLTSDVLLELVIKTDQAMLRMEDFYLQKQQDLSRSIHSSTQQVSQLEKKLDQTKVDRDKAEKECELLRGELEHRSKSLEVIEQDRDQLKALESEKQRLEKVLSERQERIVKLETKLKASQEKSESLSRNLTEVIKESDYLQQRIEDLIQKSNELEKEIARIQPKLNEETVARKVLEKEFEQLKEKEQETRKRQIEADKERDIEKTRAFEEAALRKQAERSFEETQSKLIEQVRSFENLQDEFDWLQKEHNQIYQSLEEANAQLKVLERERAVAFDEKERILSSLENEKSLHSFQISEKETYIKELVSEIDEKNVYIDQLNAKFKEMHGLATALEHRCKSLSEQVKAADSEVQRLYSENQRKNANYLKIKNSVGYQFGHGLLNAIFRPGMNTIRFPGNMVRAIRSGNKSEQQGSITAESNEDKEPTDHAGTPTIPSVSTVASPAPLVADQNRLPEKSIPASAQISASEGEEKHASIELPEPNEHIRPLPFEAPPPKAEKKLNVASILDEFTHACFDPECNLIPIRPENWIESFKEQNIDMLFVESAWHGNDDAWLYRVAKYNAPPGNELSDVINWCKKLDIPTVFWNKEDPPNFDRFVERAKEFDYIFTSDANCIPNYQEKCPGAKFIGALPFAAQPAIHNPIRNKERMKKACFAGTYYADTYEERRRWMDVMLRASTRYGLDIFDRMNDLQGEQRNRYLFPEDLRGHIRGKLNYEEMLDAYRRYCLFLNVNSVYDSPTMFSRRVFELLACGTPVISTPSLGIEKIFGKLVPLVESEDDVLKAIDELTKTETQWSKHSCLGVRDVMRKHTYKDRFNNICDSIGLGSKGNTVPPIIVVLRIDEIEGLSAFGDSILNQSVRPDEIIIVREGATTSASSIESLKNTGIPVSELPVGNIISYVKNRYPSSNVALCLSSCFYGPSYLEDSRAFLQLEGTTRDVTGINGSVDGRGVLQIDQSPTLQQVGEIVKNVLNGSIVCHSSQLCEELLHELSRNLDLLERPARQRFLFNFSPNLFRISEEDKFNV